MVPLRQAAERILIFPPVILDVGYFVPLCKFQSYIIRATHFIEQAVTRDDLEGLLIRIKLCNCLHHIELSICQTRLFIVCEKILKTLYKFAFLTA